MFKTTFKTLSIIVVATVMLASCKKKETANPQNPQADNEKITHVYLYLTDTTVSPHVVKTFAWSQMDIAVAPVITYDSLTVGKNYTGYILMMDKSKNPVDTLSNEFEEDELRLEHQFFYDVNPSSLMSFAYAKDDVDKNGVPVGIAPLVTTKATGTGQFSIVLKHQPGVKPTSGNGNQSAGSTDIDIVFPVKIKN